MGSKLIKRKNEKGQSTIEFLISFIFVLGFLFLFLRLSIVYTNGYIVHYATFLASRAYMVAETGSTETSSSDSAAFNKAKEVFNRFNFSSMLGKDIQLKNNPIGTNTMNELLVGVWAELPEYFMVPGVIGGRRDLLLKSESFLGREPSRAECIERVCKVMGELTGGDCSSLATLDDNGC
ncbi:MAG: hypothetical protein Fur0010_14160 [Bdellovibrio sp.]